MLMHATTAHADVMSMMHSQRSGHERSKKSTTPTSAAQVQLVPHAARPASNCLRVVSPVHRSQPHANHAAAPVNLLVNTQTTPPLKQHSQGNTHLSSISPPYWAAMPRRQKTPRSSTCAGCCNRKAFSTTPATTHMLPPLAHPPQATSSPMYSVASASNRQTAVQPPAAATLPPALLQRLQLQLLWPLLTQQQQLVGGMHTAAYQMPMALHTVRPQPTHTAR